MKKLSSYQKLKKEKEELYRLYERARKKLHDRGEGIEGDDTLMDFDMELPKEGKEGEHGKKNISQRQDT